MKKIIAIITMVCMMSSIAFAYNTSDTWTCSLNYVPNPTSNPCDRTIAYSTYGERATMTSHSCSISNSSWWAEITCLSGTMSAKYVGYKNDTLIQQCDLHPVVTGVINGVTFHFAAKTYTQYNLVSLSGTIACIQ